jgi:hypothetical protein
MPSRAKLMPAGAGGRQAGLGPRARKCCGRCRGVRPGALRAAAAAAAAAPHDGAAADRQKLTQARLRELRRHLFCREVHAPAAVLLACGVGGRAWDAGARCGGAPARRGARALTVEAEVVLGGVAALEELVLVCAQAAASAWRAGPPHDAAAASALLCRLSIVARHSRGNRDVAA